MAKRKEQKILWSGLSGKAKEKSVISDFALLKTVEIVISSEGDKVAGVEKSIKNRFLRFVRPDLSGLTTVEMTSFQQNIVIGD